MKLSFLARLPALIISFLLLALMMPIHAVAEQQKIRLGVVTALTGSLATIGTAVRNGIEMARLDRPELFQGVEFSYEDNQYDAKQSIAAYENLKRQSPRLIFGFGNVLAFAIGPAVERDQIPLINFNFEAAPAVGKHFIVRSMNHTDQYMRAIAEYFQSRQQTDFAIIQTDSSFFQSMIGGFKKALNSNAHIEEIATLNPSDTDFRTVIAKLRRYDSKHIGLFLWPDQLTAFVRQAKSLGFRATYFGTDLCESAATLPQGNGGLLDGCLYPDNDASSDFRLRYRKKFGNESQLTFAASAYDMTTLVGELLHAQPTLSGSGLIEALAGTPSRKGVLGEFSFRSDAQHGRFFEYPIRVKRIEGARGVAVN